MTSEIIYGVPSNVDKDSSLTMLATENGRVEITVFGPNKSLKVTFSRGDAVNIVRLLEVLTNGGS